jgi:hypothetical protein
MMEIDMDQTGSLDIDEFINLMSLGDEVSFQNGKNSETYLTLRKSRKPTARDFFKQFKSMPKSFVPSFITERWEKANKNLPSSVFKPIIDPATMLYKDYMPPDPSQPLPYKKIPMHGQQGASKIRRYLT